MESFIGRVLVMDDDTRVLKTVSGMVTRLGFHATAAIDVIDALFFLKTQHFDLVIVNGDLPANGGFHLVNRIKRCGGNTRVVIMTGHAGKLAENIGDSSRLVDGMLLKPFTLHTLREAIMTVLCSRKEEGVEQGEYR